MIASETFASIPHLLSVYRSSFHERASESVTSLCLFIISVPYFPPSLCIKSTFYSPWLAAIKGSPLPHPGTPPSPKESQDPGRPTRLQQTQPPNCLQEVDNKPFVFSFYKRIFRGGLPGRSHGADAPSTSTLSNEAAQKQAHSHGQMVNHTARTVHVDFVDALHRPCSG